MNTENRVALAARQRALSAAIERVEADAKREGRGLSEEEIAQREALTAALATLTRDLNFNTDVAGSAARADAHRGHALARGPPPGGHEFILRWRAVSLKTGLSRPTIWRAVREGRFPKPVQLTSPSAVGWLASEVDNWITTRVAQRDQQEPRRATHSRGRPRKAAAASANPQT